ncbi:MAG: hypothetical protein A3G36_05590 [Omnitrophica bacterium RIFCSPLOWO2_12_FULL_45_13]|nr:MAG: hypothetical protein A3G36_05590 [Omnitrophica bacterium RIFCSPLOWO2_12_FULL_45_13]
MLDFDIKKRFQAKPKNKIGLDIGSSAIKMLEVSMLGDKPSLVCMGLKNAPSAVRETLIGAIRSLAEEIKVTTKDVNISVSGPSVIVRFVSMPKMKDDELKSAMRFEAEKYVPFPINDCIVDHQVLKKNEKEGKLDILLVAVRKAFVLERVRIVEEAGFLVSLIDVDGFAAANAFLKNLPSANTDKAAALINIGATLTNVSIIKDSTLCFLRDITIGGDDFDGVISKALNIDARSAEGIKICPKEREQDIVNCSKGVVNNLLDEMRLSFSYYENQSGCSVDKIYISGGSAGLVGLEALFKDAFDSSPCFWDPLQFLDKSAPNTDADISEKIKGSFAIAAGLALR